MVKKSRRYFGKNCSIKEKTKLIFDNEEVTAEELILSKHNSDGIIYNNNYYLYLLIF